MKPSTRTWLSVALFVPLAAILLATFACLPAPVGDPEKSKVDPALTGIYRATPSDPADKTSELAFLRPWDGNTYYLQYVTTGTRDGKDVRQMQHFKAWLTTFAGKTFLTAEPLDDLQYAIPEEGHKPVWVVLRLDKVEGGLEVRLVTPDSEFIKGLTTREQLEKAIADHVTEQALYGNTIVFKKLGKNDQAVIDEALSKFDTTRTNK